MNNITPSRPVYDSATTSAATTGASKKGGSKPIPSTLLDETLDGCDANCLEKAVRQSDEDDELVFLAGRDDADGNEAGHVLIRDRATGRVWDPNEGEPPADPEAWPHEDVESWNADKRRGPAALAPDPYEEVGSVGAGEVRELLSLDPEKRAARVAGSEDADLVRAAGDGVDPALRQDVDGFLAKMGLRAGSDRSGTAKLLASAFGMDADDPAIGALLDQLVAGDGAGGVLPGSIRLVGDETLPPGRWGAYDAGANGGRGEVLIHRDLPGDPAKLEAVLAEEMGHHFDHLLRGSTGSDAPGDEGAVFALLLGGADPDGDAVMFEAQQDDRGVLQDGTTEVEFNGDQPRNPPQDLQEMVPELSQEQVDDLILRMNNGEIEESAAKELIEDTGTGPQAGSYTHTVFDGNYVYVLYNESGRDGSPSDDKLWFKTPAVSGRNGKQHPTYMHDKTPDEADEFEQYGGPIPSGFYTFGASDAPHVPDNSSSSAGWGDIQYALDPEAFAFGNPSDRDEFLLHGSKNGPGSAGCIDLLDGDTLVNAAFQVTEDRTFEAGEGGQDSFALNVEYSFEHLTQSPQDHPIFENSDIEALPLEEEFEFLSPVLEGLDPGTALEPWQNRQALTILEAGRARGETVWEQSKTTGGYWNFGNSELAAANEINVFLQQGKEGERNFLQNIGAKITAPFTDETASWPNDMNAAMAQYAQLKETVTGGENGQQAWRTMLRDLATNDDGSPSNLARLAVDLEDPLWKEAVVDAFRQNPEWAEANGYDIDLQGGYEETFDLLNETYGGGTVFGEETVGNIFGRTGATLALDPNRVNIIAANLGEPDENGLFPNLSDIIPRSDEMIDPDSPFPPEPESVLTPEQEAFAEDYDAFIAAGDTPEEASEKAYANYQIAVLNGDGDGLTNDAYFDGRVSARGEGAEPIDEAVSRPVYDTLYDQSVTRIAEGEAPQDVLESLGVEYDPERSAVSQIAKAAYDGAIDPAVLAALETLPEAATAEDIAITTAAVQDGTWIDPDDTPPDFEALRAENQRLLGELQAAGGNEGAIRVPSDV